VKWIKMDVYEKARNLWLEAFGAAPSVEEYRNAMKNVDGTVNPWDVGPACEWLLRKRTYEERVKLTQN
jgi:hypothetical protein